MKLLTIPTISRLSVCFVIATWPYFTSNTTHAQTAMPLPSACAAVIDSIVHQRVAPDQFAGLRNTGTILCFSELAPPELQLSTALQPAARKPSSPNGSAGARAKTPSSVSLSAANLGPAGAPRAENHPAGVAVNRAQEKINQALNHLQDAGADLEAWRTCIQGQFSADQIREPEVQASRFFKHWTQIVGLVFRSRHMNCTPDAPTMQEKSIHDQWPTRAERDEWKKKMEGFAPSNGRSEETRIYWGLKLLDAVIEYHAALKVFKVEPEHLSAPSVAAAATPKVMPVSMRVPQNLFWTSRFGVRNAGHDQFVRGHSGQPGDRGSARSSQRL